jgi:hypothetical protein
LTQIQQASFMVYNPRSRCQLPFGLCEYFPAFFTHCATIDLSVIDMMPAFFDKGVQPDSFAETMLELYSKKHIDDYLTREFAIQQRSSFAVKKPQMFSTFADKMRYAGLVQTEKILGSRLEEVQGDDKVSYGERSQEAAINSITLFPSGSQYSPNLIHQPKRQLQGTRSRHKPLNTS